MNTQTAARLAALNQQFYQTFAAQFDATRQRVQPGVARALAGLPAGAAVLDVGCGNGSAARWLAERGQRGAYLGVDGSAELLAAARADLARSPAFPARFEQMDLLALPAARLMVLLDGGGSVALDPLHQTPGIVQVFHAIPARTIAT